MDQTWRAAQLFLTSPLPVGNLIQQSSGTRNLLKTKHFARFWRLPNDEKAALIEAAFCLAASALALRCFGVKRTLTQMSRAPGSGAGRRDPRPTMDAMALAVERTALATGVGTCLWKSLALHRLLSRRHIDTRLRIGVDIGVNKGPTGLAAHSWLEHDGAPVNAAPGDAFSSTFTPIDVARFVQPKARDGAAV